MRIAFASLVFLAVPLVACGGKLNTPTEIGTTPDAATDGISGETGGEASVEGGTEASVDAPAPTPETCTRFVGGVCSDATKACCAKAGFEYNASACTGGLDYYCNALVDQVTLGKATYDATQLDACVAGWKANTTACLVGWITSAKNLQPCDLLFNGVKEPGAACNPSGLKECKAPPGFGAYCDESARKCRVYGFVGKDQPCNFYGSTVRYCDAGLYCDLASTTPTCKTARALGDACDGADDFSCGYENVCKDNKCIKGAPEGTACATGAECASFQCEGGKCTATTFPAVSSWICTGAGGG